jgi:hypothetical protein
MNFFLFADITQSLNANQGVLALIALVETALLAVLGGKMLRTKVLVKSQDKIKNAGSFIKAGTSVSAGGSITVGGTHNYGASRPSEKELAREVIIYLEDKRVLYNPSMLENPDHCIAAVGEIRGFLTRSMKRLDDNDELFLELRERRSAARKFMDKGRGLDARYGSRGAGFDQDFFSALGEMRGVFGVYLKRVALRHKLKIEDDLMYIFPVDSKD